MIPVTIPCSKTVKAFLLSQLPAGKIDRSTNIGAYLLELLDKDVDPYARRESQYPETHVLFLSKQNLMRHGGWLNRSQAMAFNQYITRKMYDRIRPCITTYLEFDKRLKHAIEYARKQVGLTEDDLSTEAIRKDFHRNRHKYGGLYIYENRKKSC